MNIINWMQSTCAQSLTLGGTTKSRCSHLLPNCKPYGALWPPFIMQKFLTALALAVMLPLSAGADPIGPEDHKSYHSLGCLILKECTDGVDRVASLGDVKTLLGPDIGYDWYEDEIDSILYAMEQLGIEVYIADGKYFPINNRGVYIPKDNTLFLNRDWMQEPHYLAQVLRHEGWHAAQDCMAGTIDNSYVAVIHGDKTPAFWQRTASATYPETCASDHNKMWDVYEPTPLTRQYLVDKGYLNE